jgi:cysteine desulfurase/selenocysteine lyase
MPGAQRFEVGNYNYVAAAAVEPGLAMIVALTTRAIEARVAALTERMIEGLRRHAIPVFAPKPGVHRAHIVAIGDKLGHEHETTDDPKLRSLYQTLCENGARLIVRRGILRLSFHFYNIEEDVDKIIDIAGHWDAKNA